MSYITDALDAAYALQQAATNEAPMFETYFRKQVANILVALCENIAGQTPSTSTSSLPHAPANTPVVHRPPS